MEITVIDVVINTREIYDIVDIEVNKTMFLNTEAGFVIKRIGKCDLGFGEKIPYNSSQKEIEKVKTKWKNLQEKISEQWQKTNMDADNQLINKLKLEDLEKQILEVKYQLKNFLKNYKNHQLC